MRWFIAFLIFIHTAAYADASSKMTQLYKKAQTLFAEGKCEQVIAMGTKIPGSDPVDDVPALARTESIIARCHFQRGEMEAAEAQLRNILFLQSTFELDPFETPAPLIEVFNKIKTELSEKARELEKVRETASKQTDVLETEIQVHKMSSLSPFVPFGFPQFEYGAKTKGIIIATLQTALLCANIASFWAKRSFTLPDSSGAVEDQNALFGYNLAQGFQFASLGGAAAVYLFGIVDGLIHKDDIIEETSRSQSRRISREEFIQKLNELKKKD